jgi:hypothetical protein
MSIPLVERRRAILDGIKKRAEAPSTGVEGLGGIEEVKS